MYYLLCFIGLLAIELAYFRIAAQFGITDRPNARSSHHKVTLRGGGIIFFFGAAAFFLASGGMYPWFMLGLALIAAISFADDVRSVPNRFRIIAQFAAMLLMFYQLGLIGSEAWWEIPLALVLCTGIINAYNFMDGINGITALYSLSVIAPLAIANAGLHFIEQSLVGSVAAAVLVFSIFNVRKKAVCFAGDVGSVSIAFILLFMAGALIAVTEQLWWLILFSVYGADSVLTIVHRLMLRENIFKAHRKHAYQIMANELKIPHVAIASAYAALQLAISLGAIYLPCNKWAYFTAVIAVLAAAYTLFMRKYYHLHTEYINRTKEK